MLTRAALAGLVVAAIFIGWSWIDGTLDGERIGFGIALGAVFAALEYLRRRRRHASAR